VVADPATVALPAKVTGALTRYRVMAYVTGTLLVLLLFVAMPLKYWGGHEGPVAVIGTAHGFLYAVYLLAAFDLALRGRWRALSTLGVLLAGTIPFLGLYVEHKVSRRMRRGQRV